MDTSPDKKALPASLTDGQDVEDRDDQNRDQPAILLDEAGKTTRSPLGQNQSGRKTLHQLGFSEQQIETIKESQVMYESQHPGEAEIRDLPDRQPEPSSSTDNPELSIFEQRAQI
jgi:hypothetical protein